MHLPSLFSRKKRAWPKKASSIRWPGAINRRSSASTSIGLGHADLRSSQQARARGTTRTTISLNPDTVWDILDKYLTIKDRSHINPKMFNSFIDGTKSGIEMTAVCNAMGVLVPQIQRSWLSSRLRASNCPKSASQSSDGGTLEKAGVTEVVSSVNA